jgi:hypothetical protein
MACSDTPDPNPLSLTSLTPPLGNPRSNDLAPPQYQHTKNKKTTIQIASSHHHPSKLRNPNATQIAIPIITNSTASTRSIPSPTPTKLQSFSFVSDYFSIESNRICESVTVVTKKQAKDFYSSLQLPKKSSPQQILLHCYVASQNQIERHKSFYGIPVWSLNHVTQMATTANGR